MINLHSLTVLITRPDPQGAQLCRLIEAHGGNAIFFPTITFAEPPDANHFDQVISQVGTQDWLIFISPQAVYASVPAIRRAWPQFPPSLKIAAVGKGTAKALQQAGYTATLFPTEKEGSAGFLALAQFQNVKGQKIAIIRGEGGRQLIDQILEERGANLLTLIAYVRICPQSNCAPILSDLKNKQINVVVCTSYTGILNLKHMLGESAWPYLKDIPVIVVSERIKILASNLGFQTLWVAKTPSDDAILQILVDRRNKI